MDEYTQFLKLLEHAILATDISTYLATRKQYQALISDDAFQVHPWRGASDWGFPLFAAANLNPA